MPKLKSHSGASKRMKKIKSGKVKYSKAGRRKHLTKKGSKRKRQLRDGAYICSRDIVHIAVLLPTT